MDPLKSLVKKKRLFSSFVKYDLLNRAAAETHLYSEEQGEELVELARDNPVAAIERLLNIIRVQSSYETFISTLERSIEIGHSQQRTVVDAQAHEQIINEIVTVPVGEKKPKGLIGKAFGQIKDSFKGKEKTSKESESKRHFTDRDKVKIVREKVGKYTPRQEFQESEEFDQDDDPLMDASDLVDSTDIGHHPIPETVSAIIDPKDICRRIPGAIHGEQMRQDSHYNHGGQPIPKDSQSWCDFSEYSTLPDTIYEQDSRDRVSSVSKSDYKRRSLTRSQSFRKNQGSYPGVSYGANSQSVSLNKTANTDLRSNEASTITVTNNNIIDAGAGPKLRRTTSTTSIDFAMGETSVRIENMQRDIESQKTKIESLTEKVSQVKVVATNVGHIQKDQDVSRTNQAKLQKKIVSMGERLTALEANGNKEEVVRKEDLTVLQTKYQELERENEKIRGREVELQAKVQLYEKRQQELQEELTTLRNNEVKSLVRTEEQIKLSRALQIKMDAYAEEQASLQDLVAGLQEKLKGSHLEPQAQVKHEKAVADIKLEQVNLDARVEEQKVNLEYTQRNVKELHGKMQASDADHQNAWEEIKEFKCTLAQYDSLLKGMKEEIGEISRQSTTMQAEMSSREEDKNVSPEKRLLTDEQKREIDDLEKRLGERIEQMGKKQKTMDGELQDYIRSNDQILLKLRGSKDGSPEWDKLHKKLEDAGREMGKINKITEKLKRMEVLNEATIQDVNMLSKQVEEQKDEVKKLIQKDRNKKTVEDDRATTDHTYSASLENLKQQVTHIQTSWEKRFEEFERKVRIDAEWIETMDEEAQKEEEELFAIINGRFEALKRKRTLWRKHPTPYYSKDS